MTRTHMPCRSNPASTPSFPGSQSTRLPNVCVARFQFRSAHKCPLRASLSPLEDSSIGRRGHTRRSQALVSLSGLCTVRTLSTAATREPSSRVRGPTLDIGFNNTSSLRTSSVPQPIQWASAHVALVVVALASSVQSNGCVAHEPAVIFLSSLAMYLVHQASSPFPGMSEFRRSLGPASVEITTPLAICVTNFAGGATHVEELWRGTFPPQEHQSQTMCLCSVVHASYPAKAATRLGCYTSPSCLVREVQKRFSATHKLGCLTLPSVHCSTHCTCCFRTRAHHQCTILPKIIAVCKCFSFQKHFL